MHHTGPEGECRQNRRRLSDFLLWSNSLITPREPVRGLLFAFAIRAVSSSTSFIRLRTPKRNMDIISMLYCQPWKVTVRWAAGVIEIVPIHLSIATYLINLVIATGANMGRNKCSDLNSSAQAQTNKATRMKTQTYTPPHGTKKRLTVLCGDTSIKHKPQKSWTWLQWQRYHSSTTVHRPDSTSHCVCVCTHQWLKKHWIFIHLHATAWNDAQIWFGR